ncbi:uncharacterized protein LOC133178086 [Saccostrea echinata]|uniref:uncharacterized protein LOC133178086 n=1 Tax=Saccostrea echinata TaxID=191078 RepID=UPI002A82A502|nr:uncharacterized protein LOC133178086 [Saccostrea echinata]
MAAAGRLDDNCLRERLSKEAEEIRKRKQNIGSGVCNLVILDTSESMNGKGFFEMKEAFLSIIEGYAVHPMLNEDVAVIQFGKDVKYLHYFSNDCDSLKTELDDVSCSGPSPMIEGFLLAVPALEGGQTTICIGPFCVRVRIILISDGKPTIFSDSESNSLDNDDTRDQNVQLLDLTRQIGSRNPIICVPVGNEPNMFVARDIIGEMPLSSCTFDDVKTKVLSRGFHCHVTNHNLEDVLEILNNRRAYEAYTYENEEHLEQSVYSERNKRLPAPGTRVHRGPRWCCGDEDSRGYGTIIGHDKRDERVNVEWDTGMRFSYEYVIENQEQFVVIPCNEPRILKRESIAVGCVVKRGPDWKWENDDGGEGSLGTVYRVKEDEIYVRWSNGNKNKCRFGYDDKFDIIVCNPFDESTMTYLRKCKSALEYAVDSVTDVNSSTRSESPTQKEKKVETESEQAIERKTSGINNVDKTMENVSSTGSKQEYDAEVLWQWQNEQGEWNTFPKLENEKIKREFAKNYRSTILLGNDENM